MMKFVCAFAVLLAVANAGPLARTIRSASENEEAGEAISDEADDLLRTHGALKAAKHLHHALAHPHHPVAAVEVPALPVPVVEEAYVPPAPAALAVDKEKLELLLKKLLTAAAVGAKPLVLPPKGRPVASIFSVSMALADLATLEALLGVPAPAAYDPAPVAVPAYVAPAKVVVPVAPDYAAPAAEPAVAEEAALAYAPVAAVVTPAKPYAAPAKLAVVAAPDYVAPAAEPAVAIVDDAPAYPAAAAVVKPAKAYAAPAKVAVAPAKAYAAPVKPAVVAAEVAAPAYAAPPLVVAKVKKPAYAAAPAKPAGYKAPAPALAVVEDVAPGAAYAAPAHVVKKPVLVKPGY